MADQTQTRTVHIVIDASKAKQGGKEVSDALKSIEDRATAAVSGVTKTLAAITAALATVATVKAFAQSIAEAGVQVANLTAQLNYATGAMEGSKRAFDAVFSIAQRTGAGLLEVGGTFQRIALGARDIGATTDQIGRVTETFIKLGRVGGASMDDINGALVQFGQSMASGRVQGDEFRSLMERVPAVMRAISGALGVTVGQLREMSAAGELTAEKAFGALQRAAQDADAAFSRLPVTLEQAGNRSANAWKLLGAALDEATGMSGFLARALQLTADHVTTLAKRISGDVVQAVKDTTAAVAALEQRRAAYEAGRGGKPRDAIDAAGRAQRDAVAARGAPTDPEMAAARQRQAAAVGAMESQEEAEALEKGVEARIASARADEARAAAVQKLKDDLDKLRGTYDKNFSAEMKAAEAQKKYNEAVAAGAITQAQAEEAMAKYRASLVGGGGGGSVVGATEKAQDALDKYMESVRRERDVMELSVAARAELTARLRAEELARNPVLRLTEEQIKAYGDEAAAAARAGVEAREQRSIAEQGQRQAEEQARRQADMMAEPYKNALRGMQSATTDFFQNIFDGGTTSFASMAKSLQRIWSRLLSEMISQWIWSQMQMQQSPMGGGMGGAAGPMGGGIGGGLGGLGGGMGGIFSGIGSWVTGLFGGGSAGSAAMAGQASVAAMGGTGASNLVGGAAAGSGAGAGVAGAASAIPIWGWIAAAAMMAKSMVQGANPRSARGVVNTLLAPSIDEWMADPRRSFSNAINPAGTALSDVFGGGWARIFNPIMFLPGFGTKKPPRTPQGTTNIELAANASPWARAFSGGSTSRGDINSSSIRQATDYVSQSVNRTLYDIGAVPGANMLGGYVLNSIGNNTGNVWTGGLGNYNLGVAGPGNPMGARELPGGASAEEAMGRVIANIIRRAATDDQLVSDGSGLLTATILTVLRNSIAETDDELQRDISIARQYDDLVNLSRAANDTHNTIEDMREQFRGLSYDAGRLGLDIGRLDQIMADQIARVGTDFLTSLSDQVLEQDNPLAYARAVNQRTYQGGLDDLNALLAEGAISSTQFADGLANLNALLERANAAAAGQGINGALGGIEQLMRRLTYGDLSLASPGATMSGMQASYAALTAQARAGDPNALSRYAGEAGAYADYVNRYYGGNAQAAAIRSQVFADAANIYASGGDPTAQLTAQMQRVTSALLELIEMMRTGQATTGQTTSAIQALVDQLQTDSAAQSGSTVLDQAA